MVLTSLGEAAHTSNLPLDLRYHSIFRFFLLCTRDVVVNGHVSLCVPDHACIAGPRCVSPFCLHFVNDRIVDLAFEDDCASCQVRRGC